MKSITPELINSLTPVLIAIIGGIIGVTIIIKAPESANWASGMGLAGTAIAGAAGLAQSSRRESTDSEQNLQPVSQNKKV